MDGWNEAATRGTTNQVGILPRARTLLGLAFALLLLTAAALTPAATAGAQSEAQSDQVPASIDELFALFGVGAVPADFVVVVDTSGSMSQGENPPYPAVLGAYQSLVDSIPEGDNLSRTGEGSAASRSSRAGHRHRVRDRCDPPQARAR